MEVMSQRNKKYMATVLAQTASKIAFFFGQPRGPCSAPRNQLKAAVLMDNLIPLAAQIIREGGTVVFPTETVYGIGSNALNPEAVARIFEVKRRPRFNPLIVHLSSIHMLEEVASEVPAAARLLAETFWPGPLTLVLPKKDHICDLVTAGLPTIAVRMPNHPIAQALLRAAGVPIAAPSANRFTRLSPTLVSHAQDQLGTEVDLYLDGGPCTVGVESTIVGWIDGRATLLRRGGLAVEDIEAVIGTLDPIPVTERPLAPGNIARHYSPKTPLLFSDMPVVIEKLRRVGLLTLKPGTAEEADFATVSYLSDSGDLRQAAHRLFVKLKDLESLNLDLIVARSVPNEGLGAAINDRLTRAGHA
jgi:L-threonylcarbamoyladenylate synthase